MASPFDLQSQLVAFSGKAPLFPLPQCVLFPHILLPLHIYEPRYRQMTADALEGDRLIAMALLKEGAGDLDFGLAPPIHSTVCLGRIIADERLSDGRYYLVLQGLSRAKVTAEIGGTGLPYRTARLDLLQDEYPPLPLVDREHVWQEVLAGFRQLFPDVHLDHMFQQAKTRDVPLGVMCDVLAYAMKLKPLELQQLLEESNVDLRGTQVVECLRRLTRPAQPKKKRKRKAVLHGQPFPPQFSVN